MRDRVGRVLIVLAACCFLLPCRARADEPSIGITMNAASGVHVESNGTAQIPLLPVPIFSVQIPMKHFSIRAEMLPPFGSIAFHNGPLNLHSTKLGYAAGALFYALPGTGTRLGIGATLINQQTGYGQSSTLPIYTTFAGGVPIGAITFSEDETNRSRVAGARFALVQRLMSSTNGSVDFTIAASPSMHATVYKDIVNTDSLTMPSFTHTDTFGLSAKAPESASLVDMQVEARRRFNRLKLTYGLRYINYAARFDRTGILADRNCLVMPFAGLEVPVGL